MKRRMYLYYECNIANLVFSISGLLARRCEIAKLQCELTETNNLRNSLRSRIESIEASFSKEPKSLAELLPLLLKTNVGNNYDNAEITDQTSNRLSSGSSTSKAKLNTLFKSMKKHIATKISDRHERGSSFDSSERPRSESLDIRSSTKGSEDSFGDCISVDEAPFWHSQVRDLPYFHGVLPRNEIIRIFSENGNVDGHFLIRESTLESTREKILILSVFWEQTRHFRMASQNQHVTSWSLTGPRDFSTIADMISYYIENGEHISDNAPVKLIKPINRSSGFLQNEWISINSNDLLGQGAYGSVYVGIFFPPNQSEPIEVAVKKMKSQFSIMSKEGKSSFYNEARQMQNLKHPNIVRLIGVAASREPMMLIMELCKGGSLLGHLRKQGDKLSLCDLYCFAAHCANGMNYLSKMHVIHRDLAARNCLLTFDNVLKISDFGLARSILSDTDEAIYQPLTPIKIPVRWTAPETFLNAIYTSASDVWSYGIVLWEIFSAGTMPWPECQTNDRVRDVVQSGVKHQKPEKMPQSFYDMVMSKCFIFEPEERINFQSLQILTEGFHNTGGDNLNAIPPPVKPRRPPPPKKH